MFGQELQGGVGGNVLAGAAFVDRHVVDPDPVLAGLCTKFRYVAESAYFVLWLAY